MMEDGPPVAPPGPGGTVSVLIAILFLAAGYLIGSIPTGLVVARARGVDLRSQGSGNIGATNVLRSIGPGAAVVVVLMDPVKGALATWIPLALGMDAWVVAGTALTTVLGNGFNLFLRMRGDKGVATSLGAFLVIAPLPIACALAVALIAIAAGRMVSLGSIVGMASAPLFLLVSGRAEPPELIVATILALLAAVKHRENLRRLAAGTERRLGDAPRPPRP